MDMEIEMERERDMKIEKEKGREGERERDCDILKSAHLVASKVGPKFSRAGAIAPHTVNQAHRQGSIRSSIATTVLAFAAPRRGCISVFECSCFVLVSCVSFGVRCGG